MPLIHKREIDSNAYFGIWEVTETENELLDLYPADETEISLLNSFTHSFRKKQFLASRLLLHTLFPTGKITYDANGKPWLNQPEIFISLSHSASFIAILIDKVHCGIDIEVIRPKIEKIVPKFLSEKEIEESKGENLTERLHIYWCAKEAMYKVYGKKNVSLRTDIFVNKVSPASSGKVGATLSHNGITVKRDVYYERFRECMLAWTESPNDEKQL
jgi:phosphopantetheinyl transferase